MITLFRQSREDVKVLRRNRTRNVRVKGAKEIRTDLKWSSHVLKAYLLYSAIGAST